MYILKTEVCGVVFMLRGQLLVAFTVHLWYKAKILSHAEETVKAEYNEKWRFYLSACEAAEELVRLLVQVVPSLL